MSSGQRDRSAIPATLLNESPPATEEMVSAAMSVPMWNHMLFANSWARASDAEVAEILGQMFEAMRLARSA